MTKKEEKKIRHSTRKFQEEREIRLDELEKISNRKERLAQAEAMNVELSAILDAVKTAYLDNDDPEQAARIIKGWTVYSASLPGVTLERVLNGEAGEDEYQACFGHD